MSPNMQIKRRFGLLLKHVKAFFAKPPKKVRKHHLGSHSESVYIWTLLGKDAEESQEMRIARNDRRTNGFNSVQMTIGTRSA